MPPLPQDDAFGYKPRTELDAERASKRGWWVSDFEHMPNGMVRVVYSFKHKPNVTIYIQPAYWNADVITMLGRSFPDRG